MIKVYSKDIKVGNITMNQYNELWLVTHFHNNIPYCECILGGRQGQKNVRLSFSEMQHDILEPKDKLELL